MVEKDCHAVVTIQNLNMLQEQYLILKYTVGCTVTSLDVDGREFNIDLSESERRDIARRLLEITRYDGAFAVTYWAFLTESDDNDGSEYAYAEIDAKVDEFNELGIEERRKKAIQCLESLKDGWAAQEIFCKVLEKEGIGGYQYTCEDCGDAVYEYTLELKNKEKECNMEKKELIILNKSNNPNPSYAKPGDSGFDLIAYTDEDIVLKPFERRLIHTGIYCELPEWTEIQVRPRSGMALKKGLTVLNTPGTVDVNYRGEIGVIAINLSSEDIIISNGERIAQAVICPVFCGSCVDMQFVDEISEDTERGKDGFGSTGA